MDITFTSTPSILDIIYKVATVLIATVNTFLVVYFFVRKKNVDDKREDKSRKIQWLKAIVLDYNLKHLYAFFDNVEMHTGVLLNQSITDSEKSTIEEYIQDEVSLLRKKFLDMFIAVDMRLYKELLDVIDSLMAEITKALSDKGSNLNHKPKYEECIVKPLMESKTEVIRVIFKYEG